MAAALATLLVCGSATAFAERPDWAGFYVNANQDPSSYTEYVKGQADRIKWANLEPTQGSFDWSPIDGLLTRAADGGYYCYFALWSGDRCPNWVYDSGVPTVYTDARGSEGPYPYYLDPDFLPLVATLLNELAAHIASLPEAHRNRLAFIQPGFGSTGDRQLYKGEPTDSRYRIDGDEYVAIMKDLTIAWHNAFGGHSETRSAKFLWNIDDYDGTNPDELVAVNDRKKGEMIYAQWMRANYDCHLRKQQFTIAIGYNANKEIELDNEQRPNFYGWNGGAPDFVRGEHNDKKWSRTAMALLNLKWHYYWTAVASVDRGLDMWETNDWAAVTSRDHEPAFKFSNRYSYHKIAADSPYAFVALRDILDSSDTRRFPEAQYGAAAQDNATRISNILADYAAHGAAVDDMKTVTSYSRSAYLLNSKGLNDVGWRVIARNYSRFITQIDPNATSVGHWRVGPSDEPYGRYARGFENSSGKNAMYFQFDDGFFNGPTGDVVIRVIYKDQPSGSTWALQYDVGKGNLKTAYTVTNTGADTWKTKTVVVSDALMAHNGPNGADIALVNTDRQDDIFHMIEIERTVRSHPPTSGRAEARQGAR